MERHEQLQKEYLQVLEGYIQQLKVNEANFRMNGDKEALVREKVKANVVDIFQKMFTVSYNNVYVKRQIPDFVKYEEAYGEKEQRLYAAYMDYFEKIPRSWREKAEKDKKFGRIAEYETEQIKLQLADEVQSLFIEHFHRIFGGF